MNWHTRNDWPMQILEMEEFLLLFEEGSSSKKRRKMDTMVSLEAERVENLFVKS